MMRCERERERKKGRATVRDISRHTERMLQCVAVCCSVLQCVAVCCSVLVLQCIAVCCNMLQCVSGHKNRIIINVTRKKKQKKENPWSNRRQELCTCSAASCRVSQCVAMRCSALRVLHCVAVRCSALQCVAVRGSV